MLTIKNPRKGADAETGIQIGSFKLVDAGLTNRGGIVSVLENKHYSFHWSYNDEPHRFKCYLEREPVIGTKAIYNFEIYDDKHKGLDYSLVQSEGLIYAGTVGLANLRDRIGFYTWMTNQIVKHM
jgi:hypothetical protein